MNTNGAWLKWRHEEHIIASWSQFADVVLSPHYANWAFRGHSDATWPLESTLGRRFKTAQIDQGAWVEQESRILRIFKRKAHLSDWFPRIARPGDLGFTSLIPQESVTEP